MKTLKQVKLPARSIIKDERGQALVEYILVTPVVMFFFFVILQYMLIMIATQLSNYAVYAAARVYAVQFAANTDGNDEAAGFAKNAAAMVMAPVSGLAPGELPNWASVAEDIVNMKDDFGLPDTLNNLTELIEGYALARYWRNDIAFTEPSGSPKQITAVMTYKFPIMVPGFRLLWDIVGGATIQEEMDDGSTYLKKKAIFTIPSPNGMPGALQSIINTLNSYLTLPLPYVAINAKCSMGYEDWDGTDLVTEGSNVGGGEGGESPEEVIAYQDCMTELETLRLDEKAKADIFETKDNYYLAKQDAHYAALKAWDDCAVLHNYNICGSWRGPSISANAEVESARTDVSNKKADFDAYTAVDGYNETVAQQKADALSAAYETFDQKRNQRDQVLMGTRPILWIYDFHGGWHECLVDSACCTKVIEVPADTSTDPDTPAYSYTVPVCVDERTAAITLKGEVEAAKEARDIAKRNYEIASEKRKVKSDECENLGDAINPES